MHGNTHKCRIGMKLQCVFEAITHQHISHAALTQKIDISDKLLHTSLTVLCTIPNFVLATVPLYAAFIRGWHLFHSYRLEWQH